MHGRWCSLASPDVGTAAIAFHEPTARARCWPGLPVPAGELADVVEQEMWREPGVEHDLTEVVARDGR